MVSAFDAVGLLVIIGVNTFLAAVTTRLFRNRLETVWGPAIYTLVLGPVVLTISTLVLSGILLLGGSVGSRNLAMLLAIALPLTMGVAVDYFWMPSPDEVELPDTT